MDDAPVPTTATDLPDRSTSWRQVAEWKTGPEKSPNPFSVGMSGRFNCPTAVMSTLDSNRTLGLSGLDASTIHRCRGASKWAAVTS
jgi:hypothetical protein